MINKIKNLILVFVLGVTMLAPAAISGTASARVDIKDNLCAGSEVNAPGSSSGCAQARGSADSVQKAATNIINLLSWVVGIISVIMIIVAGFRYITSGGASEKVTGAKNTLIYAVIGLIIVALAQFIVNFVLNQTMQATE